ncbi:THO complex subunit 1 transcription elongation factor-domain-containing protein, partial [Mycena amicta]
LSVLKPHLTRLLESLPASPPPEQLKKLVERTLLEAPSNLSPENCKSHWEHLLKSTYLWAFSATEGQALKDPNTPYYAQLKDLLDVVLTFTELEACEQTLPFIVLQDLLEMQTIASCSHIFSWIESRAERLTEGLVPQKGKALVLLRTLNDLLRRLSKTGTTTIFCGRILTLLSAIFPLGERSGVNLRGEYGPTWDGVWISPATMEQDVVMEDVKKEETEEEMQVDEPKISHGSATPPQDKNHDFYNTFWSLQLFFSKPPLFAVPNTFDEFKDAVSKVLPVIKEATAKERAMMGSRAGGSASHKRKREPDADESPVTEYFFAKFLTSPDLLDLEIADTHFRRQFLFQLAILLTHLQTFTKAAKSGWATARNRSLQMDFTLEQSQAEWVQETLNKVMDELKQTTPNGRAFAETVSTILEREKNWVKWKNELCTAFDKEAWSAEIDGVRVGLMEASADVRRAMWEPPHEWDWRLGSEPLTEIWDSYRELRDVQTPFHPGEVKDFVNDLKKTDARIELRQKRLAVMAERAAAQAKIKVDAALPAVAEEDAPKASEDSGPVVQPETPAPPPDDQIIQLEESKQRIAWLALRTARELHLQHFGKIGMGDIEQLAKEIEAEKRAGPGPAEDVGTGSPMSRARSVGGEEKPVDGDIKMEDR